MPNVKRPLRWSPEAEEDLFQIWGYLAGEASRVIADRQVRAIRRACQRLTRLPYTGRARDDLIPNVRSILVPPYLVFHRVDAESVDILRILHGSRNLKAVFKPKPDG